MNERRVSPLFEGSEAVDSSVLEEETLLLLSNAPVEAAVDSRVKTSGGLPRPGELVFGGDRPDGPSDDARPMIDQIRDELEKRRKEDSTRPASRRPRLEKKLERAVAARTASQATVADRRKERREKPVVAQKSPTLKNSSRRSFAEVVFSIPILGNVLESLVLLFSLPSRLRDLHVKTTKKETVLQARLDGIGSRVTALREEAALNRREIEEEMARRATSDELEVLARSLREKLDAERFEEFSKDLSARLAGKGAAEEIDGITEIKSALQGTMTAIERLGDQFQALESEFRAKAGAETVNPSYARLDAFEIAVDAMRVALAGKAGSYELASLSDRFAGLASTDRVASLEESLASLSDRIAALASAENVALLEESLAPLSARLAGLASAESLASLEESLASLSARFTTMASSESVASLEESLASLSTRLAGLAPSDSVSSLEESLSRRLATFESGLEQKADLEIVKSLISLGMDVEVLKRLGESLEKSVARVEKAGGQASSTRKKAEGEAVKRLDEKLDAIARRVDALDAVSRQATAEGASPADERLSTVADKPAAPVKRARKKAG